MSLCDVLYYFAPLFYRATVDLHDLRRQVAVLVKQFGHEDFLDEHKSLREPVSRLFTDLHRECERNKTRRAATVAFSQSRANTVQLNNALDNEAWRVATRVE